ncbi:unnamed protein product [Psylliodes chrysocephalus]|uniref:Uncharacterized protein n=1 Tax=Psylliodes chrysocephalus TaxID=3402493 RepID=A0A9P0CE54_9CUCU|nr:unnamed protein product [Psylliodes chrysocephala]
MKYLFTLVNKNGRISQILHQYPEPGHSFLPGDRSFGLIEKNKRKKERIYLPSEWIKLVEESSKKFKVVPVEQDMILNFSDHLKQLFKSVPKGPKKEKFAISTYRLMKYTKNDTFIKCSVSSGFQNFTKFSINEKGDIPFLMPTNKAYFNLLDINPKKINDLKSLVQKYVPLNDQSFYNRMFQNITTVEVEDLNNSGEVNKNRDEGNIYTPSIWYYNKLSFLLDYTKPRKSMDSISDQVESDVLHGEICEEEENMFSQFSAHSDIIIEYENDSQIESYSSERTDASSKPSTSTKMQTPKTTQVPRKRKKIEIDAATDAMQNIASI